MKFPLDCFSINTSQKCDVILVQGPYSLALEIMFITLMTFLMRGRDSTSLARIRPSIVNFYLRKIIYKTKTNSIITRTKQFPSSPLNKVWNFYNYKTSNALMMLSIILTCHEKEVITAIARFSLRSPFEELKRKS